MNDMATALREFIKENFLFGADDPFADGDSLLEKGIIDSTGVLELVGYLETTYGVTIEDEDLVPENLDSINRIARFVESKRQAATTS